MNRAERRRQKKTAAKPRIGKPSKTSSVHDAYQIANRHHSNGDLQTAEELYQQILEQAPDHVDALCMMGVLCQQTGRSEQAVDFISKSIALNPDFAGAHNNLGEILRTQGRLEEAKSSFEKAIALNPGFAEAHNNLGALFKQAGRLDLAGKCYSTAIALKPEYAEPYTNLGNVYDDLGQPDSAIEQHRKAISVDPHYLPAHRNLGKVLYTLGRLDEAVQSYRHALKSNPDDAESWRQIAHIKRFESHDADIAAMEQAFDKPDLPEDQKMHLAFALGKAFDDIKQFDKAFDYYKTANALKRRSFNYALDVEVAYFTRIKNTYSDALFRKLEGSGVPDATPIFIVGMPRSGTTLVEQILASHPDVYGAGELSIALDLVQALTIDATNFYPENIQRMEKESFRNIAAYYLENLRKHAPDAKHITDKMPGNFLQIGLIKLMLPQAKIIHCRRGPKDTCLSIYKNLFSIDGHYYGYDLEELGGYYNLYLDMMAHWRKTLPEAFYDLNYETLVQDKEPAIRDLLAYCGLEWNDACLESHKTKRKVSTASAEQVRQPIYSDSVESWKNFEAQLSPLLNIIEQ